MKKKTLLSSILTIALCLSLIAGTTYALFTSEDDISITVNSGKVEITAVIKDWVFGSELGATLEGSSAGIDEKNQLLTLTNIVPGDYVTFNIVITNTSNVTALYRTSIWVAEDEGIYEKLKVTVGDAEFNGVPAISAWQTILPTEEGTTITVPVRIELPTEVEGEEYMGKSCKLSYKVEAVQGNAGVKNATALEAIMMYGGSYSLTQDEAGDFTVSENVKVDIELNDNALNNTLTNNGEVTVSGGTINAEGNNAIYNEGTAELKDVTVNMTGNTGYITNSRTEGSVTVYENVTATSSGGGVNVWEGEALFKSGTITTNSTSTNARHMFYIANGATLTIEDGEFFFNPTNLTRKGSYICAQENATVIVNGGTFHKPSTRTAPIQALDGSTVTIYGGTFYFDPSAFVAEGYEATKNSDGTWTVGIAAIHYDPTVNGGLYEYLPTLKSGDVLVLPAGTYETSGTFRVAAGVTIMAAEGTEVIFRQNSSAQDNIFNCEGDVTFKNITFESNRKGYAITDNTKNHDTDGDITLINCTFKGIAAEKNWGVYKNLNGDLIIENCTFDNYDNAICGVNNGGDSSTVITGCTFTNINGEAIGYVSSTLPADFEADVIANNTGLTEENVIGY